MTAFEDVQNISWMNRREFETITKKIVEDLKSGPELWERKIDAVSICRLKRCT